MKKLITYLCVYALLLSPIAALETNNTASDNSPTMQIAEPFYIDPMPDVPKPK